ncbi:hypothetical protein QN386_22070 [Pseudomonas sp. CCI3.2]|uniref:hypothetical protein n=1 Tax=unclassified Pseudomonas TaxID=196821 RepID=UPI002AC8C299|nr:MULTISPECIES: hypothetical protein [unclassified Pseudomonas]MEB0078477.1 hypothetical protein [Pseudomonas sp. MH10out]MEB0090117.1 hypothetical protein [Pseudomonas sp. CCI4.2]MEB0103991.1 hypothetical protein [Pseudomonas sp. CCI3.2]MEB0131740.1 hypothetical protein [Pseudomonas sp. CCI2.4]MEB0158100.1 hypothetical protein [Pseudomonas sp. AH2 (2023)]
MQYTSFSDVRIKTLVESINKEGYAVLPGWATNDQLVELKNLVMDAVGAAGNRYVALTGQEAVSGSLLHAWGSSPVFIDLCQRIVTAATGRQPVERGLHQVLRCLIGEGGQRESMIFHYDSFVLTTIMPVCMPEKTDPGDLLMLRNHRPLRRNYFFNLIDKMLVDNRWTQRWLKKNYADGDEKFTQIRMLPGDLYLFWGYRSLHTNLPADPNAVRATAVFHYDNLHENSTLASRIRRSRELFKPRRPAPVVSPSPVANPASPGSPLTP